MDESNKAKIQSLLLRHFGEDSEIHTYLGPFIAANPNMTYPTNGPETNSLYLSFNEFIEAAVGDSDQDDQIILDTTG